MLASTLTSKGQATIPAEVRKALHLGPGDVVEFRVVNHQAVVTKAKRLDASYHRALAKTLTEWNSAADDEAYKNL